MISELLSKSGTLITFLHDRAFEKAGKVANAIPYSKVELFLGFLETSEVIFELSGSLVAGEVGKWAVILVIQILK